MMRIVFTCAALAVLGGCAVPPAVTGPEDGALPPAEAVLRPKARNEELAAAAAARIAPPPARTADSAEEFDTTTAAQREAAAEVPVASAERALGTTITSLGNPAEPGFWLKTPLVSRETPGRAVYPANGKSVQVTLIPIDGPATAGSRMSLPALRLIEAPLTELTELQVFAES